MFRTVFIKNQECLEEIQPLLDILKRTGGNIAGGYARFLASPSSQPSDIDIFTTTIEQFESIGNSLFDLGFTPKKVTEFAETFEKSGHKDVQIVRPSKGRTIKDIVKGFDFTVSMIYLENNGTLVVHENFFEHEANSKLVVNDSLDSSNNPLGLLIRVIKYVGKGYSIGNKELLKILDAWASLSTEEKRDLVVLANNYPTEEVTLQAIPFFPETPKVTMY
jgi:hypothetical protein